MRSTRSAADSAAGWGVVRALGACFLLALACAEPGTDQSSAPADGGRPECAPGEAGCVCARGDTCAKNARGESLVCRDGFCAAPDCAPGETGCVCRGGTLCGAGGDECRDGVCKPVDCRAGEEHCDCLAGTCDAGLYCARALGKESGGTCVDGTGYPYGSCLANGLCHEQSRCDRATDTCVPCEAGSQGCVPSDAGCNNPLVPVAGRCLPPAQVPPEDPQCYSTCREDRIIDGELRRCSADGYMAGCFGKATCVKGSCLTEGQTPRTCSDDAQCPEFQTCLTVPGQAAGRCYSTCGSADSDCPTGLSCHRHVCRIPCATPSAEAQACPRGMFCDATDGQNGVCMPLAKPDGGIGSHHSTRATYSVTPEALSLNGVRRSGRLVLSTDSLLPETFDIVKVEHRAFLRDGTQVEARADAGQTPLPFLELRTASGRQGGTEEGGTLRVSVPAHCQSDCPSVEVRLAAGTPIPESWTRWEGTLEVRHPDLGVRRISIAYAVTAAGRWAGSMHYFASFPDREDVKLWSDSPDKVDVDRVNNGLIRRWAAFRRGNVDGGFEEVRAMLSATATESWRSPSVADACQLQFGGSGSGALPACYLFDNGFGIGSGVARYVNDYRRDAPIPTGGTELPIAIHLRADSRFNGDPARLAGRIDTATTLHYPGQPEIQLAFAASPVDPAVCEGDNVASDCVVYLSSLSAEAVIGARSASDDGRCPEGQTRDTYPWLLPDFLEAASPDGPGGALTRTECRDEGLGGNPIPDGNVVRRRLSLLDGALVNQNTLFILFEEHFASSLDAAGFSGFGYMLLERQPTVLSDADFAAEDGVSLPPAAPVVATEGPTCKPELLDALYGDPAYPLNRITAPDVAAALVSGIRKQDPLAPTCDEYSQSVVHYLCEDTGLFNGGAADHGNPRDVRVECPRASNVTYFVVADGSVTPSTIAREPCQQDGSCAAVLSRWVDSSRSVRLNPGWTCADGADFCSFDRSDLRSGKRFCKPNAAGDEVAIGQLDTLIQDAFRYKTRFQNDRGGQLGFAPRICDRSERRPYCYDPAAITQAADRIECLLAIYREFAQEPRRPEWNDLRSFLSSSLSHLPQNDWNAPLQDGFERLYAELLVMQGDEAYTKALSSRFDLAAAMGATFKGSMFEAGGMDLSGIAGFEMHALHQALQYYTLATDRFYRVVAPAIQDALDRDDIGQSGDAIITADLVHSYMVRLIGASTKRARAWSEISRRYQSFNRHDLARRVIKRSYSATYLESTVLSQLMLGIANIANDANRDAVVSAIERAQRQYRVALDEMRQAYSSISEDTNVFGFSADYIDFPAVDENDTRFSNAFEEAIFTARRRTETAKRFEEDAITSGRSFETDAASFQAELVRIGLTHEQRLREVCGAFAGDDGVVYPATAKYRAKSAATAVFEDPCGLGDNGAIRQKLLELAGFVEDLRLLKARIGNVEAQIEDERRRVEARCELIGDVAEYQYQQGSKVLSLNDEIRTLRNVVGTIDRTMNVMQGALSINWEPFSAAGKALLLGALGSSVVGAGALEFTISDKEREIEQLELDTARWVTESECLEIQIESDFTTRNLLRSVHELELETRQLQLNFEKTQSEISRLYLEAQRAVQEQAQSEQLVVEVESARNDPNIRLYRNAAVMNADRSFHRAMRHAYRATRILEYFSSQSYARTESLFLVRMVGRGYDNLENYLDELEDEYDAFRSQFRTRANRVERISLKNDIFQVHYRDGYRELAVDERGSDFTAWLTDTRLLDLNGHRSIPFRTSESELSPCTFGHQIKYIEMQVIGSGFGDDEADLMLWQDGTGVVKNPEGERQYYRLEPRLLVANPFFGTGARYYDPAVYRRYELRDRPFVNTSWKLVIDQKHNRENQDIDLEQITDVYLFVYYTDFTNPSICR